MRMSREGGIGMSRKSVAVLLTVFFCVVAVSLLPSCGGKEKALPSEQRPAGEAARPPAEERKTGEAKEAAFQDLTRWKELGAELIEDLEMLKASLAARERELAAREAGLRSKEVGLAMREAEVVRKQEAAGRVQALSYVVLALGVVLIVAALVITAKERRRKAAVTTQAATGRKRLSKGGSEGPSE